MECVLLTNLGPNQGKGGYVDVGSGEQNVTVTLADLDAGESRFLQLAVAQNVDVSRDSRVLGVC